MHSSFGTPFELKFLAATGLFEGYASVFNVTDSVNDRIVQGAFSESLAAFRAAGRLPPLLWQHNGAEPIGQWREMYEDDHGLYVRGELFINDLPLAKEAYRLLKESVVTGLSIGYRARGSHRDEKSGARVLTEVELLEVSLVTFPANEHARVVGVKKLFDGAQPPSLREFESFLHQAGFSRKQAKAVVAKGYKALLPTKAETDAADESAVLARFRASLVQAAEDNKKAALALAFPAEQKRAGLQDELYRFSESLKRATEENLKAGYSASQPRAPRGTTEGGQWTDGGGGGGSTGGGVSRQKPPAKKPRHSVEDLIRYEGDGLGHPLSPLDFIGGGGVVRALKPIAAGAVQGAVAARNAARLRGYLSEARKIPKGIIEIGNGHDKLSRGQVRSLKEFSKGHSSYRKNIEIINYSDGRVIYSVKHPSKKIPGSYAVWDKQVDSAGEAISVTKTTVGPNGELVHIKNYKIRTKNGR